MSPWPHKTGPFLKLFLIFDSFPIIYSPSWLCKRNIEQGEGDFKSSTTVKKREEDTK